MGTNKKKTANNFIFQTKICLIESCQKIAFEY